LYEGRFVGDLGVGSFVEVRGIVGLGLGISFFIKLLC